MPLGEFFCDVCSTGFRVHSDDGRAVCPDCGEDVLDVNGEYEPNEGDFLDPIDFPGTEDSADYD